MVEVTTVIIVIGDIADDHGELAVAVSDWPRNGAPGARDVRTLLAPDETVGRGNDQAQPMQSADGEEPAIAESNGAEGQRRILRTDCVNIDSGPVGRVGGNEH